MSVSEEVPDVWCTVTSIVDRRTIEHNVLTHLQTWMVPYLAAIERHHALPVRTIMPPKSWRVKQEFARRPQDTMPMIAVVSTGINSGRPPQRDNEGNVRAWWLVAVGAVCAARTDQDAKDLSGYYGAAIKMIMQQVPDLGGWASGVDLNDERYDDWSPILEQMVSSVRLVFTVEVEDVINVFEGFKDMWGNNTVPPDPYDVVTEFPEITEKVITVDKIEEDGD